MVKDIGAKAQCRVCPRRCVLSEGQYGYCRGRKMERGRVVCDNYGKLTAVMVDPIEKKPLRRFYPGSLILSVGSYGCNLSCPFCQNHEISMAGDGSVPYRPAAPDEVAALARAYGLQGNIGVAFTYNEPLIGYEFVCDTARIVHDLGMKTVVVTNGFADLAVLEKLLPVVDAMNVDLKGFTESYYGRLGGDLATVKAFIAEAAQRCHVEVTTLIVPGENDGKEDMEQEAAWLASLRPDIPLHITRFFPRYHMKDKEPTDKPAIYALLDVARAHLSYVYAGNC